MVKITKEDLLKSAKISEAGISEEVLNAILETNNNFFGSKIKAKQGEAYQHVDDALRAAGYTKKAGEATSAFAVRVAEEAASKGSSELTKERDDLKAKVADLENKLKEGAGDVQLKQELADTKSKLNQANADIQSLKTEKSGYEKKISNLENQSLTNTFEMEAEAFFQTLTFNPKMSPGMVKLAKQDIKQAVLKKGAPSLNEKGDFVFKDAEGNVLNNPANNLNPFSFQELVGDSASEYIVKDAKGGGGTGDNIGRKSGGGGTFSIVGMKTKREVTAAIQAKLASDGIAVTDESYQEKFDEMYKTEGVSDLPV